MSSKLLYSITDDNKNLQKKIGCMSGFFQLFDRQHFTLRLKSVAIKRLPSGQAGNRESETYNAFGTTIEDGHEGVREKQRNSTESSRTSVSSSSWSSSYSSLECNRTNQREPSLYSPAHIPGTPSQNKPVHHPNLSHSRKNSYDLQDVVRDNIHKGSQGLSVKTATNEKVVNSKFKHVDSPRPVQLLDSSKPKASGIGESPGVHAKFGEAPCRFVENRSGTLPLKDARSFSYDGRELRDSSQSSVKLKELPRLSLDSKRGSIKESNSTIRPSKSSVDLQRGIGIPNNNRIYQKEPESYPGPSSVVAKLMGLETFPTVAPSTKSQTTPNTNFQEHDPLSKSSNSVNEIWKNRSPRTSMEAIPPKIRNLDSIVKSHGTSKIPIESAPWRQKSESKGPCTPSLKGWEYPENSNSLPSVYGEIDKRLAELEFRKSGRDLRALKQLLEAMQKTKDRLDSNRESCIADHVSLMSNKKSVDQSYDLSSPRSMQFDSRTSSTVKGIYSQKNSKSMILIMEPSEHVVKNCSVSFRSATDSASPLKKNWASDSANSRRELIGKQSKDMNTRKNYAEDFYSQSHPRNAEEFRQLKVPPQTEANSFTSSSRSSGNASPRPQQKRLSLDKYSRSTIASPDSNTPRSIRQCSKKSTESGSLRRKLKPRNPVHTKINNIRDERDQGSMRPQQLSSTYNFFKPAAERQTNLVDKPHEEKPLEGPTTVPLEQPSPISTTVPLEQPSPISVLDAAFYKEDLPSPIKKISNIFRDNEPMDTDEAEQKTSSLIYSSNSITTIHSTEISHNNNPSLKNLVLSIEQTYSTHETPNLRFEETNSDHKYILEVLSASGLLTGAASDMSAVQLHPSGNLLDPKLFIQLEKSKVGTWNSDIREEHNCSNHVEKIQRQLTFDAVNEILLHKFVVEASLKTPQSTKGRSADKKLTKKQIFRDICNEIDNLQINCKDDEEDYLIGIMLQDLKNESMSWTDCQQELSGIALDIERLIFKDLINEVVSGDIGGPNIRAGQHCRLLFRNQI